jgi:hypothetical protein
MNNQTKRDLNWLKHQIKLAEDRKQTEIFIGSKPGIEREKGNIRRYKRIIAYIEQLDKLMIADGKASAPLAIL